MRGFRNLRPKKHKKKLFVDLKLEKDGEIITVRMKTSSMWDMAKKVSKLSKLNMKGWNLVECTGNDVEKVEMFNKVAKGHVPSGKEALQFGGLDVMPKRLKKFFRKDGENGETDKDE